MRRPNYEKLETGVKREFGLINDCLLVERCWVKDRSRSGTQR